MTKLHHKEQDLQIRCVRWFRVTYPEFARLLEHPKNEVSSGNRTEGAIAKAEGVQAGVNDLIFHAPSLCYEWHGVIQEEPFMVYSLGIELKEKNGRQSPEQKNFQRYFEAAGNQYEICRSLESFQDIMTKYVNNIPARIKEALIELHNKIREEQTAAARQELKRIINK